MVRTLARLLGLFLLLSIVAGAASAIAALSYKKKAPPRPPTDADELDLVAVMDGVEFASTAPGFRGGRLIAWYAGVNLDLREATFDPAGADLEARTVFGGTRIIVAPGVPVTITGPAIFGAAQAAIDGPEPAAGTPGLRIGGFTAFGGLQVIAVERGAELPGGPRDPDGHDPDEDRRGPGGHATEVTPDGAPA